MTFGPGNRSARPGKIITVRPDPLTPLRSLDWDEPISVDPELPLRIVAAMLDRYGVGAVLVAARDEDAGIVSERDLVAAIAGGADIDLTPVRELSSRDLVTADPDEPIVEVAARLLEEGIRHVAILDEEELVGVVSIRDLLAVFVAAILEPEEQDSAVEP